MRKFVRNNLVLLIGILLPVLLVAGFLILAHLPRALVDPPRHDFLVVGYRYDYQQLRNFFLGFEVRKGKLTATITPKEDRKSYHAQERASLYRYRAADNSFEEISYELPDGVDELTRQLNFAVAEAAQLTLDKRSRSPDGFTFEFRGYSGSGGLLGGLFGIGHHSGSDYVLRKDSAAFELPPPVTPAQYYYGQNLVFLGWVVNEDTAP